jgi:hypothetical protein
VLFDRFLDGCNLAGGKIRSCQNLDGDLCCVLAVILAVRLGDVV